MSYQVLARKWRPKRFADLVGQEHVVRALGNALNQQRLHHAYLLTGTRGVGKTTIARILAKSLNCEQGVGAEPCGECSACVQIDSGRFVDLLEIDAASNTGIDNIREVIENAQYAPTAGRYKVYIIDEVHMLSKSAFNAMLKTLEEPPAHVKFILATTDPQKVPVTVLSRCLQFSLRNMTAPQIASHLSHVLEVEGVSYDTPALVLLARAAAGSMRDALSLLDQAIAYGLGAVEEQGVRAMLGAVDQRHLFALLAHLAADDGSALLAEAEQLAAQGSSLDTALSELAVVLQQIALAQTVPTAIDNDEPERDSLFALAELIPAEDVQLYYQIVLLGRRDLPLAPDDYAGFTMTLLRLLAFHPSQRARHLTQAASAPHSPTATTSASKPTATSTLSPSVATSATGPAAARALLDKIRNNKQGRGPAVTAPVPTVNEPPPTPRATPAAPPTPIAPAVTIAPPVQQTPPPVSPPWEDSPSPVVEVAMTTNTTAPPTASWQGDWYQLVQAVRPQLGAGQVVLQHAEYLGHQGDVFRLRIPEGQRRLVQQYQEKLTQIMQDYLGHPVRLAIEFGTIEGETHFSQQERLRREQLEQARQEFAQDEVVQQLVNTLDAVIIEDSIRVLTPPPAQA